MVEDRIIVPCTSVKMNDPSSSYYITSPVQAMSERPGLRRLLGLNLLGLTTSLVQAMSQRLGL